MQKLPPIRHTWQLLLGMLLVFLLIVPSAQADVLPAKITVNTSADKINNDGKCSIIEAMQTAIALRPNTDCGPEVSGPVLIDFSVSTIYSTDQFPNLVDDSNVTLMGPVVIVAGPTITFDLDGGTLNLINVTVKDGTTIAMDVHESATANLAGVSFMNNSALVGGAAISNRGTLRIAGGNFTGNTISGGSGGAIENSGKLQITGSVFNGNVSANSGGAIFIKGGEVEISDTVFNGNIANGDAGNGGGAIAIQPNGNLKPVRIIRSVFNGNLTPKSGGGAIFNNNSNTSPQAQLQIESSSFQGNLAGVPISSPRPGGAILNWGSVAITSTVFLNNAASNNGGALANGDAVSGTQNSPPQRFSRYSIVNSSFIANAAAEKGGAIADYYITDGNIGRIINSTFSLNTAVGEGGAYYSQEPNYDIVRVVNTIMDGNLPSNCADGSAAALSLTSDGNNLDSANTCGFVQSGDIINKSAALDSPNFNGGPIAALISQKPKNGSPAIDAGNNTVCSSALVDNKDQRGEPRPKGAACDIGAIEVDPPQAGFSSTPTPPGPIHFGNVLLGSSQNATINVVNTGDNKLKLSNPTITGSNANDFSLLTDLSSINSDEFSLVLRCQPTGNTASLRQATFNFATNDPTKPLVSFNLTCNAMQQPVPGFGSLPQAPGPIDFGTVLVGSTVERKLQISEQGNATLNVTNPVLGGAHPGDFSIGGGFSLSLTNNHAPVDVSISCTPTAPGLRSATLQMNTNDPTKPTVLFNLSCLGKTVPPLALDTASASSVTGGVIALNGPYGVALSPDGRHLYLVSTLSNSLHVYARNPQTGVLTAPPIQSFTDAVDLNGAIRVHVSPDGENVYVTSPQANTLRAYKRDTVTGQLTFLDQVKEGMGYGCLPIPCDGNITGMQGTYGFALSPDGQYIYFSGVTAAANGGSAINVIRRSSVDGSLVTTLGQLHVGPRFVQRVTNSNLNGVYDLAISPDGAYLYAASYHKNPDTITVFKRNATDGKLTYDSVVSQSQIPSLNGVFRITISQDGKHLYASSFDSNSIVVLERNLATGRLTHIATYTDGGTDALGRTIDGLSSTSSTALSPDGSILYATGFHDNAVAAFERDPESGKLTFIQVVKRNNNGQPPLAGARDIAVGPENRSIHVSGFEDDRLVTLLRPNPKATLTSLQPASATAGSGALTLVLNGSDFLPDSVVRWNNATNLTPTYLGSNQLQVTVPANLLTQAGSRSVTVNNPSPGGGTSNTLTFTIVQPNQNPVPSISELSPSGALAGDPATLLTVKGSNFLNTSTVSINGVQRITTYVSPSTLQVQLTASDLQNPGNLAVRVSNPAPGGGNSNIEAFNVAAPGQNPVPTITSISPSFITIGANGALNVVIKGNNFVQGAQATWNGEDRLTTFVSATEVHMLLNGTDLTSVGNMSVQVQNPAPGGGASNAATFRIGALEENPKPTIASVVPAAGVANNAFTFTIGGSGFMPNSTVTWNNTSVTVTYVNATQLRISVPAALYGKGSGVLKVQNPAPGGGNSNEFLYNTYRITMPMIRR